MQEQVTKETFVSKMTVIHIKIAKDFQHLLTCELRILIKRINILGIRQQIAIPLVIQGLRMMPTIFEFQVMLSFIRPSLNHIGFFLLERKTKIKRRQYKIIVKSKTDDSTPQAKKYHRQTTFKHFTEISKNYLILVVIAVATEGYAIFHNDNFRSHLIKKNSKYMIMG